ncbi:hypothetical protein P4234_14970 [Pseudomonas aeruginosa]|nr:hypothetical protein [Pseudomonas aeruginosa]
MMRFRPTSYDHPAAALLGALPLIFGIGGDAAMAAPAAGHHHRRQADRRPGC